MAIGDAVIGIAGSTGSYEYFQPAATVVVVITSMLGGSRDGELEAGHKLNGSTLASSYLLGRGFGNNMMTPQSAGSNTKIVINTNLFLRYQTSVGYSSYSGIQIA